MPSIRTWAPRVIFACAVLVVVAAWFDWIGTADDKASSAARKCQTALTINMLGDATSYCGRALDILAREPDVTSLTTARVHMQAATLGLMKGDLQAGARHCTSAIAGWRQVDDPRHEVERRESIELCEKVIAKAGEQPAPR